MEKEKRLIDANALSIQIMDASYWDNQDEDVIWNLVQDAPTVDAVEVVRCENCKHWCKDSCAMNFYYFDVTEESFCSYGERREGE